MGVNIFEDCITQDDGTLLCYDKVCNKYYALNKREIDADAIPKKDLHALVQKFAGAGAVVRTVYDMEVPRSL